MCRDNITLPSIKLNYLFWACGLMLLVLQKQTQRLLRIHVLIGSALFLAPVLKFLPRAVLQGVFFYMGIASLTGNNLFDRLK